MHTDSPKITGILLAGGLSKRMGREKGILRIGNALLYQYPLGVLESVCDEVLVSTCNDSVLKVKHRIVCDEVKGMGPMGGIYSCLKASASDLNLVLSYDMPLVNDALFRLLLSESATYDIVLPGVNQKRPEPLCGLYRKSIASIMKEMMDENDLTVHHLLKRCNSNIITISSEMECWRPDLFMNINSKEDLNNIPTGFGIKQYEE